MKPASRIVDFVRALDPAELPPAVRSRIAYLVRDFVAVSVAGRVTATARIAADVASVEHAGDAATALFDGRRLATSGAAFANGVLANALDLDDGHRLVKGHPGANVIPAALAVAEETGATAAELLAATAIGYEVAIRAGLDLHARSGEYHASGAWGAVGAAGAAARLLELDTTRIQHALGLAEYHAPIAPVMRSVAEPAMTKDACGWGAYLGVSSARLAAHGFTALSGELLGNEVVSADLGDRWHVLDVYVKKFPCCRWSHPAIQAALELRSAHRPDPKQIQRIGVRTFSAAAALARRIPTTTEEAQYSLIWPVAVALAHGRFDVEHVLPPSWDDALSRRLTALVHVDTDPSFDAVFPGRRPAEVTIETAEGAVYRSDVTEAPGDPEDVSWEHVVEAKYDTFAGGAYVGASLAEQRLDQLLVLLSRSPDEG